MDLDPTNHPDEPGDPSAVVIVDVANVMGSRPDGWWRDRAGAAGRLLVELAPLVGARVTGPDGALLRVDRLVAVVEGQARGVRGPAPLEVVAAAGSGDDTIVAVAGEPASPVIVVTADRGLRARLPPGVSTAGPRWLLEAVKASAGPG